MKPQNCIKNESSFMKNYFHSIIVLIFITGLAFGFGGGNEPSGADSCKQQICFKHPNGTPASGYGGTIKNSLGVTVGTWTSDPDGCIPSAGANLNSGESHTVYVATSECATDPVGFVACTERPLIVTLCE